ncbi:MAG: glycosyltransferase family 4 protein, partial [Acidobacteriota bacterium]|nr:glycosyltransferase family 4 protein [Acidobacteriota bacterium]
PEESGPEESDRNGAAPFTSRFIYFGQIERKKGVIHVLRGLRALLDRAPRREVFLDIVGGGSSSFRNELERERERLGLNDAVQLRDFVPRAELMALLPRYTAAVLPLSDGEPFGYSPVEAGAVALPVITTRGPGASECFPPNYRLFLQDRECAQEMADRMDWCVSEPHAARAEARDLQAELRRRCDFKAVVFPAYERVLRSLTPKHTRFDERALLAAHRTVSLYSHITRDG